jgi:hypothetical protein
MTLSESSMAAFHYVLFNKPASLPSSGTLACDSGTFTTPTYIGQTEPSSSDLRGRITGTAQLSFLSSGATVQLAFTVSNSGSTGAGNFSPVMIPPSAPSVFTGKGLGANQNGVWIALDESGTAYDIVGGYILNTNSGMAYTGTYRFHCK